MKLLDVNTWNRKQLFEHFMGFHDPYFAVSFKVDVTMAYKFAKSNEVSFFTKYLHACLQAMNDIENFRYRLDSENRVVVHDVIHASATILRPDKTFGFSFIHFDDDILKFQERVNQEKERIFNSQELFPPTNSNDCIHCSSLPWLNFTGHKEPFMGIKDSVPKVAFSKVEVSNNTKEMTIALSVNHALVDGYHVGVFKEKFQFYLNA